MNASITVRGYVENDVKDMIIIWNQVVEEGLAFPQVDELSYEEGLAFFAEQTHCGVAVDEGGRVLGLYVLHPNNIGRCGHIANASYAVERNCRGVGIGEALVRDSLDMARRSGFTIMQFNAVVANNSRARRLYSRLGFVQLEVIPEGFRLKDGRYEDICPYYKKL